MTPCIRFATLAAGLSLALAPVHAQQPDAPMNNNPSTGGVYGGGTSNTTSALAEEADTNTSKIFTATVDGVFECFRWQPVGVCVWLVCTYNYCYASTTVRVRHYTPDVTISTWHDKDTHPWSDYGRRIAQSVGSPAQWMMSQVTSSSTAALALDSAGTKTQTAQRTARDTRSYVYRGTDAIGNPVNFVTGATTGDYGNGGNSGPSSVPIPTPYELMMWLQQFPQQVADQWASIPSTYTTGQLNYTQQQSGTFGSLLGFSSGSGADPRRARRRSTAS